MNGRYGEPIYIFSLLPIRGGYNWLSVLAGALPVQVLQEKKTWTNKVTAGTFLSRPQITNWNWQQNTASALTIGFYMATSAMSAMPQSGWGLSPSIPEQRRLRWPWLRRAGKLSSGHSGQSTSWRENNQTISPNCPLETHVFSSRSRRNRCWNAFISSEVWRKCFCWCWNYNGIILKISLVIANYHRRFEKRSISLREG